jgi:hypothetical protein
MNNLQWRYFRNVLTVWVVLVGLYCGLSWITPLGYVTLLLIFASGALIYGIWFFGRIKNDS